ncbi:MAG: putative metalloprotease CJM1_0395 family protein [Candidatus Xenobia bacterium]
MISSRFDSCAPAHRPASGSPPPAPVESQEYYVPADVCAGGCMSKQAIISVLQARNAEVHEHEYRHMAAAGEFCTGGPEFKTVLGPDGREYAVGGDCHIDTSPVDGNPQATLAKMRQLEAACMAPGSHLSTADLSAAAQCCCMACEAQRQLDSKAGK